MVSTCGSITTAVPFEVDSAKGFCSENGVIKEMSYHSENSKTTLRTAKASLRHKYTRAFSKGAEFPSEVEPNPNQLIGEPSTPWVSSIDGKELGWSWLRKSTAKVVLNPAFETFMGVVIVSNLYLMVYEADEKGKCFPKYADMMNKCPHYQRGYSWDKVFNQIFLILYTAEGAARVFVSRTDFMRSRWNQIDTVVIATGWFCELAGDFVYLSFLRIFRVVRLTRAFRVVLKIRELYLLLNGVISSLKAIFWGTVLLFTMLVIYGIILVEWVHQYNSNIIYYGCTECTHAFGSVWESVLTLFKQIIAGDSWIISFPLIEKRWWIALIMIFMVVTTGMGVMNLILTVIVERAAEAREKDRQDMARQKDQSQAEAKKGLLRICQQMDKDQGGTLTSEELLQAYDESNEFRDIMVLLDVQREDMEGIFKILDVDNSGDLDYEEFCEELIQLESNDQRMMLAMTRFSVHEVMVHLTKCMTPSLQNIASQLDRHENRLESIDLKLDKLVRSTAVLAPKKVRLMTSTEPPELFHDAVLNPTTWSPDRCLDESLELPTAGFSKIIEIMRHLQADMQSLAVQESDLVREAERQVSVLLSHADLVASFGEMLPQENASEDLALDPMKLGVVRSCEPGLRFVVTDLQKNITEHLSVALSCMQQNVSDVKGTIDVTTELVRRLQELCPDSINKEKAIHHVNILNKPGPITKV